MSAAYDVLNNINLYAGIFIQYLNIAEQKSQQSNLAAVKRCQTTIIIYETVY